MKRELLNLVLMGVALAGGSVSAFASDEANIEVLAYLTSGSKAELNACSSRFDVWEGFQGNYKLRNTQYTEKGGRVFSHVIDTSKMNEGETAVLSICCFGSSDQDQGTVKFRILDPNALIVGRNSDLDANLTSDPGDSLFPRTCVKAQYKKVNGKLQ